MIKTIKIQFLDLDGNKRVAPMTMDWNTIRHNDIIDLIPLQEKLKEAPKKVDFLNL